jgi:hypothetical protein
MRRARRSDAAGPRTSPSPLPRAAIAMLQVATLLALAACSRRASLASCDDDLRGVYRDGEQRWMILDRDANLEAYPLFPDADGPADVVTAPRRIELKRATSDAPLAGALHRRYMRGAQICEARIAVHVTRCAGDTVDLVLADPSPPIGFAPCAWPRPAASRLVHWQRE